MIKPIVACLTMLSLSSTFGQSETVGVIPLEAECVSNLKDWSVGGTYTDIPSGEAIESSNGHYYMPEESSTLSYTFNVDLEGQYYFYVRSLVLNTSSNSFHYRIDGGDWHISNGFDESDFEFQWYGVNNTGIPDGSTEDVGEWEPGPIYLSDYLSTGEHTLEIAKREANFILDKMELVHSFLVEYLPTGFGGSAQNCIETYAIEAECGIPSDDRWELVSGDATASQGEFMNSGDETTYSMPVDDAGQLTYEFTVNAPGTYAIIAHVKADNDMEDSFWLSVNGGDWNLFNDHHVHTGAFRWDRIYGVNEVGARTDLIVHLDRGVNTIKMAARESNAKVDKFIIQKIDGTESNADLEAIDGFGPLAPACNQQSSALSNEALAIETESVTDHFVYPNPATDLVNISAVKSIQSVVVYALNGEVVKVIENTRNTDTIQFNVVDLDSGVYLVKVQGANGNSSLSKLFVQ